MSPPFGRNEPPMVPSVGARDLGTMLGRGRTPSAGAGVRGTIDRMGGTETPVGDPRRGRGSRRRTGLGACARAVRGRGRRTSAGSGGPRALPQRQRSGSAPRTGDLDPRVRVRGVPRARRQRASRAVRAHPAASARRDAPGLGGGGLADAGRMAARGGARVLGPRLPRDRACGCGTGTRGHRRGARTGRSCPAIWRRGERPQPAGLGPHASGHVPRGTRAGWTRAGR